MRRVRVRGLRAVAWIAVLSASACAGPSGSQRRTHQGGDTLGAPRVEALPSLDIHPEALTPEMRMAQLLSAECLNQPPPPAPHDLSTAAVTAWSQGDLEKWMRQKQRSADEARKQLDVAAAQSQRQRIMAGALVGLLYEDLARSLLTLPTPRELVSEPAIAAMYGEVLRGQAAPYLRQAALAYDACKGNAQQMEKLAHWSTFCDARREQLPGQEQLGSGETRVEVVRN